MYTLCYMNRNWLLKGEVGCRMNVSHCYYSPYYCYSDTPHISYIATIIHDHLHLDSDSRAETTPER